MKYVRLLKDTPTHQAGAIFGGDYLPGVGFVYVDITEPEVGHYPRQFVEGKTEWFEEVEQIFVRPFNTEKLKKLDELANGEDIKLADHFGVVEVNA